MEATVVIARMSIGYLDCDVRGLAWASPGLAHASPSRVSKGVQPLWRGVWGRVAPSNLS